MELEEPLQQNPPPPPGRTSICLLCAEVVVKSEQGDEEGGGGGGGEEDPVEVWEYFLKAFRLYEDESRGRRSSSFRWDLVSELVPLCGSCIKESLGPLLLLHREVDRLVETIKEGLGELAERSKGFESEFKGRGVYGEEDERYYFVRRIMFGSGRDVEAEEEESPRDRLSTQQVKPRQNNVGYKPGPKCSKPKPTYCHSRRSEEATRVLCKRILKSDPDDESKLLTTDEANYYTSEEDGSSNSSHSSAPVPALRSPSLESPSDESESDDDKCLRDRLRERLRNRLHDSSRDPSDNAASGTDINGKKGISSQMKMKKDSRKKRRRMREHANKSWKRIKYIASSSSSSEEESESEEQQQSTEETDSEEEQPGSTEEDEDYVPDKMESSSTDSSSEEVDLDEYEDAHGNIRKLAAHFDPSTGNYNYLHVTMEKLTEEEGNNKFKCCSCSEIVLNEKQQSLRNHVLRHHTNLTTCRECGKVTQNVEALKLTERSS